MEPGRPTKYKPEYDEMARKLCLLGHTDAELAEFFEVTEQTINNWKHDFPSFFESIKAGKRSADANVAASLYHRALGYSHSAVKIMQHGPVAIEHPYTEHYPPDTAAAIFWLKNRRPDLWRDKQEVYTEVKDSRIVVTTKDGDEKDLTDLGI